MCRQQNAGQNHNIHKHLQSDKIQIFRNNNNVPKLHALRQLKDVTFSEIMLRFSSQLSVFSFVSNTKN